MDGLAEMVYEKKSIRETSTGELNPIVHKATE